MIQGSCLCGGVTFEVAKIEGPVELCHCNRCRKVSGTGSLPMVGVAAADYTLHSGADLIESYAAPILYSAPAYRAYFCRRCGSPVPPAEPEGASLEIPAGLFDGEPGFVPDKHIFVDFMPAWDVISDDLPQFTLRELVRERHGIELPTDFEAKTHAGPSRRRR